MDSIDPILRKKFEGATHEVAGFLRPVEQLAAEEGRKVIQRYVAVFEGNFLSWMSGGSIAARSLGARYAADENLLVELRDNHPGMLRGFAVSCAAEPEREDYAYMQKDIAIIRNMTKELSGLKNICLMGVLENTSAAFVPYLAELGKKLGCEDFTYTNVHGEADIQHANQFLEALTDEQMHGYVSSEKDIDSTIQLTLQLLKRIFA